MNDYNKYIIIDPKVRFGKPIIIGTRISVYDIVNWLANKMTHEDIISDFPELTVDKINACLHFVAQRENRVRVAS